MSINPTDEIYVKVNGALSILGTGFSSEQEIKTAIENQFDKPRNSTRPDKEIMYGVLSQIGHTTLSAEDKPSLEESLTEQEYDTLVTLKEHAEKDPRINACTLLNNKTITQHASIHGSRVRYKDGQADFTIELNLSKFDFCENYNSPPPGTDLEFESQLRNLFDQIIGEKGLFLGCESGFKSRGRKNPYVTIVGRLKRNSDKDITLRSITEVTPITDVYWTEDNLSKIKSHVRSNYSHSDKQDLIAVLDLEHMNHNMSQIGEHSMNILSFVIDQLENNYQVVVQWVGTCSYKKSRHICIGVDYTMEK